jgi:hypothetical protein
MNAQDHVIELIKKTTAIQVACLEFLNSNYGELSPAPEAMVQRATELLKEAKELRRLDLKGTDFIRARRDA